MNQLSDSDFYLKYRKKVYHIALSYFKDRFMAEDVSHEVMIKCFEKRSGFKGTSTLDTWVYCVAKNYCIDKLRKMKGDCSYLSEGTESLTNEGAATPEAALIRKAECEDLKKKVALLPEKYKVMITLYYFENLSLREIQLRLKMNLSTIKIRIYRAKLMLKKMYQAEGLRLPLYGL
ncbi:hypothetical protein AF332_00575 [Sporosarcina globispora]|uniref:RNA polymerase subunit sigma-24 n=1 Tax=Sporosarcina globispora TaxID=1459 RepID=A0A0M0G6J9_SPOGL|nr:sigma-70 family RNA polymerase sigma factor [Sporosarcina globispora]KON85510.1 hypothetical protein AF332_00575 [Sporosarcina globispora]